MIVLKSMSRMKFLRDLLESGVEVRSSISGVLEPLLSDSQVACVGDRKMYSKPNFPTSATELTSDRKQSMPAICPL